jgi:hypothetical protein
MGGSTAKRRINCPGSLNAEKAAPEQATSEYAARGSMLHAAMELLLTADPQTSEECQSLYAELVGQDLGFGEEHTITQDLLDTKLIPAFEAWEYVCGHYEWDDWFIEQRVNLESVIPGAFGTTDVLGKDIQKRLHVLDWKFGDGVVVPVEGNEALGFYAGAAMYDEDQELVEFCADITGVVLHIVQPRTGSDVVLHTWETSEDWVEKLVNQAARAMEVAQLPDPPLKAGSWCQFCRARVTCPAQQALASTALSNPPKSMTSVELGAAMTMAQQLKTWIAEVVKLAQIEAEAGAVIPGYKLVNKRPTRVWADEKKAEKIFRSAKVPVGKMFARKLISPTQAQKLDKELYDSKLSDIVAMHSSGTTLVADSDKRQAIVSSTELLANALPEQKQET